MAGAKLGGDRLTDREREFLLECLVDGNGTRAAMTVYRCKSEKSAGVLAAKVLAKPRVRQALQKLLEQDQRGIRLKKRHVLQRVSDSLNRDLWDFEDQKQGTGRGICVSSLRALPKQTHAYIDGFEVEQFHDDPEHPKRVTRQKIKVRLSPSAAVQEMAMKFKGLFAPEKHLNASLNTTPSEWEQFLDHITKVLTEEERQDPIERQIEEEGG